MQLYVRLKLGWYNLNWLNIIIVAIQPRLCLNPLYIPQHREDMFIIKVRAMLRLFHYFLIPFLQKQQQKRQSYNSRNNIVIQTLDCRQKNAAIAFSSNNLATDIDFHFFRWQFVIFQEFCYSFCIFNLICLTTFKRSWL
jgi:hypothetical protein